MKNQLTDKYNTLAQYFKIDRMDSGKNINKIIKESIQQFVTACQNPAIWCYGRHTKMLMADFIFEMKNVEYIIDETYKGKKESGFFIIGQDQIRNKGVDGIIISSYKYREEIKKVLRDEFGEIRYLDIYNVLEKNGIFLSREYYSLRHPYDHYLLINAYNRRLREDITEAERRETYENLIRECVGIKDFRSAIGYGEEYIRQCGVEFQMIDALRDIYGLQQEAAEAISDKNVFMLCIDGLRRQDMAGTQMSKVKMLLDDSAYVFGNAYSVSTSTYESLIPAYSENSNLRTGYFEKNIVQEGQCRFIRTAIEQGRKIYFYTDSVAYIESDRITVTDCEQTVSEKLWDFVLDAVEEEHGLFYVHILYESHYSYSNPYTTEKLVADGSSIMFDFLARNGGRLRTDYGIQHRDALAYLDDTLFPVLSRLKMRFVLYADHGNIILPQAARLNNVSYAQVTFHEDLIQIPLIIKSPEMGVGFHNSIISLMEINDIIVSLLKKEAYVPENNQFIKIVRSEIYNPDFRYLYRKNGQERGMLAFEGFIFSEGYKLIVYSDGVSELYESESDRKVTDDAKKKELINLVRDAVTVADRLE